MGQGFGQNICGVVSKMHDIVKLYIDMFDVGMSNMVFS
jgi:hypothetical protein